MTIVDTIEVLSSYAKYRQGRGKKYAEPDVPFGPTQITDAIKEAVKILRAAGRFTDAVSDACL